MQAAEFSLHQQGRLFQGGEMTGPREQDQSLVADAGRQEGSLPHGQDPRAQLHQEGGPRIIALPPCDSRRSSGAGTCCRARNSRAFFQKLASRFQPTLTTDPLSPHFILKRYGRRAKGSNQEESTRGKELPTLRPPPSPPHAQQQW